MADIPSGNYTVALGGTRYAWAGGTLNVSGTSPNQTATYKGQSVTNLNVGTTSVGWDVTINNQGTNYPLSFTGGQYSVNPTSGKGQITGGSVSGLPSTT